MLGPSRRDLPWLLALQTTLFVSVPVWVASAWGRPATHPFPFLVVLLLAAAVSALIFHIAPASLAARQATVGRQLSWVLVPVVVGYLGYAMQLLLVMASSFLAPGRSLVAWPLAFAALLILAFARPLWKATIVIALLIGIALSIYMLFTPWSGVWAVNSRLVEQPEQESANLAMGLVSAVAPAIAPSWRIGALMRNVHRIWLSAVLAFVLPLCLSVTVTALMAQAGENLFWRPSLPLGLNWALLGPRGGHSSGEWRSIIIMSTLSLLGPILLSLLSVRLLSAEFGSAQKLITTLSAVALMLWMLISGTNPLPDLLNKGSLNVWTALLVILGVAAGLACLLPHPGKRATPRCLPTNSRP